MWEWLKKLLRLKGWLGFLAVLIAPTFGVSVPGHVFCNGSKCKTLLQFIPLALHALLLTVLHLHPKPSAVLRCFVDPSHTSRVWKKYCFSTKKASHYTPSTSCLHLFLLWWPPTSQRSKGSLGNVSRELQRKTNGFAISSPSNLPCHFAVMFQTWNYIWGRSSLLEASGVVVGWEGWGFFCFVFFALFLTSVQWGLCWVSCVDLANYWIPLLEVVSSFSDAVWRRRYRVRLHMEGSSLAVVRDDEECASRQHAAVTSCSCCFSNPCSRSTLSAFWVLSCCSVDFCMLSHWATCLMRVKLLFILYPSVLQRSFCGLTS